MKFPYKIGKLYTIQINYSQIKIGLRAFTSQNSISSYFTIPKNYFINYNIPFYNTLNIPTFILQYNTLNNISTQ